MGLFDIFRKSEKPKGPYRKEALNDLYELLFCDNIDLYKSNVRDASGYPWNILFSDTANASDLQQIIDNEQTESRLKLLAYHRLRTAGHTPSKTELLGIVVEVGLDIGLDVLASFRDGTARYINQSEHMLVWETKDEQSETLTKQLFMAGEAILPEIGPWPHARKLYPAKGHARISFLVSDGLYFGEGSIDSLFNDVLGKPALTAATELMLYLTRRYSEKG